MKNTKLNPGDWRTTDGIYPLGGGEYGVRRAKIIRIENGVVYFCDPMVVGERVREISEFIELYPNREQIPQR